jgi:hypothetical protein
MSAKDLRLSVIPAALANKFVKQNHYSGKVVPNSSLHFGVYWDSALAGVMQFGPSINKNGTINTVAQTGWNDFIELNRMAFTDKLPKNSESRAIAIAMRLIRKNAPHIKWVVSFADATMCGDGAIYRASGFKLVGIAENTAIRINPADGSHMHVIQAHHKKLQDFKNWEPVPGHQLKYIYFIDKTALKRLTVPIIPFNEIKARGIGMYKGVKKVDN